MKGDAAAHNRAWAAARARLADETGSRVLDWGGRLPLVLVYPNSYHVGMSNLGLHALYQLWGEMRDVVCERAFYEPGLPPLSLENQRPLKDFAVVAFTLSYELDYFNLVPMLRAADMPLYARERDAAHPLLICGGPAVSANPMPVSDFFDAICIGEAETILPPLTAVLQDAASREETLKRLAALPGVYVPGVSRDGPVRRQCPAQLCGPPVTTSIVTPHTELGDLFLIEVERGCDWGCRFCLAGEIFAPARYLPLAAILEAARAGVARGMRIGLVGAAVTSHPEIEAIMAGLKELGANVSVSSLRIKPLPETMLRTVLGSGGHTLTLAPEAGSERLRRRIRKGFTEADILRTVARASAYPLRQLKLYFMIGLPGETDDDVAATVSLCLKVREVLTERRPGCRLSLNVAPFVPKAGTPFQWLGMAAVDSVAARLELLRRELAPRGISVKAESPAWSEVQAVLARGDRSVGAALAQTRGSGLKAWARAVAATGLDIDYFAHRDWDPEAPLPWQPVQDPDTLARLKRELEKNQRDKTS